MVQNADIDRWRGVWPGRDNPEPPLLGAKDTQLGRTVPLVPTQGPVSLIQATGTSQGGYIATIHAQVIIPPDAYPAGVDRFAPVVGLLQWGQGGATFNATIDLRTGVCASLVASSVQLSAVFEPTTAPDQRATTAQVSAAVVWGTRPGRARATRTLGPVTLAPAASTTFEVPPFASTVALFAPLAAFYAPASTSLLTLHEGPLVTDRPELAVTTGQLGAQQLTLDGVALAGLTRFLTVTNNEAAPIALRAVFGLEL